MEWHPHANQYPLVAGDEFEALKADIAKAGVREPIKVRVLGDGRKQGIDGRNRKRACNELGKDCPEEIVELRDYEVEEYIDSLNLHRRHLRPEERQKHVVRMRQQGMAAPQIAAKLGVSTGTVCNDLAKAEAAGAKLPAKLATADGRSKALLPLCLRCQRVAPSFGIDGCPDCERLRRRRPRTGRPAKRGRKKNWNQPTGMGPFNAAWGALLAEVNAAASKAGAGETPQAEGFRRRLAEFKTDWMKWLREISHSKE